MKISKDRTQFLKSVSLCSCHTSYPWQQGTRATNTVLFCRSEVEVTKFQRPAQRKVRGRYLILVHGPLVDTALSPPAASLRLPASHANIGLWLPPAPWALLSFSVDTFPPSLPLFSPRPLAAFLTRGACIPVFPLIFTAGESYFSL